MKCMIIEENGFMNFYSLPNGIDSVSMLVEYAEKNQVAEFKVTNFNPKDCIYPVFISENFFEETITISSSAKLYEKEIAVATKKEYDEMLEKIINIKCVHCVHYREHKKDDLESYRHNISVLGRCPYFEPNNA